MCSKFIGTKPQKHVKHIEPPSKVLPSRLCAKFLDDLQGSIALHRQSRNFAPDFLDISQFVYPFTIFIR